jgi:hypothetical protein
VSSSDAISGALGVVGAIAGAVVGVILTVKLQDRSDAKRRRQEEFEQLKLLDASLMEAMNGLISHRATFDDNLAPIDGGSVERTNPSSQEFKTSLTKALEAFPFPVPDVDSLTSSNTWGAAAISLAKQWKRDVERINSNAAELQKKPGPTRKEISDFLSEASMLVNVANLISTEGVLYRTVLTGVFSMGDRTPTKSDKEYMDKAVRDLRMSTESLYESIKQVRSEVKIGSNLWQSLLKKMAWPEI